MPSRNKSAVLVGLTGGIACGKSEAGKYLKKSGAVVIDTDQIAHDLIRPGQPVYLRVIKAFGREILKKNGEIDRRILGEQVFSDEQARQVLNRLIHPSVKRLWRSQAKKNLKSRKPVVVMIPLLFEVGEDRGWDAVICVTASKRSVIKRLRARGLTRAQAESRMAAQMPLSEKSRRADYVIRNDGSLKQLATKTEKIWNLILDKKRGNHG